MSFSKLFFKFGNSFVTGAYFGRADTSRCIWSVIISNANMSNLYSSAISKISSFSFSLTLPFKTGFLYFRMFIVFYFNHSIMVWSFNEKSKPFNKKPGFQRVFQL